MDRRSFLAADVGGTRARIGLVAKTGDTIGVLAYRSYACADYPDLASILREFVHAEAKTRVDRCVLAVAGYVIDGVVINRNLPWKVDMAELRGALKPWALAFINDFEALAHGVRFVEPGKTLLLSGPETADGPVVLLGPGTGLGAALSIPGGERATVLATEAGKASLAPGDAREREVLSRLARQGDYVSYERVLCGPGLMTLYGVLCEMRGDVSALATSEAVTAAARAGSDAAAVETLQMFCALMGGFAGNLALSYGARGGVYLMGGLLPTMRDVLLTSRFVDRFLDKGGARAYLERVPVKLVDHERLGVIGAAGWYLDKQDEK